MIYFLFALQTALGLLQSDSLPFGSVIANNNEVYFFLDSDTQKLNTVSIKGALINRIHIPKYISDETDFNKNKDYYAFFERPNKQVKIVSIPHGFVFESTNDTLRRIDLSYKHSMTNQSHVFEQNDTIFKFGGYGYWSNRNFFSYFSNSSKQWEFYKTNKGPVPPGLSNSIGVLTKDDKLFVLQGELIDNFTGVKKTRNINVWKFDFSTKTWQDMGVSNIPNLNRHKVLQSGLLIGTTTKENELVLVDLESNNFEPIKKNNSTFTLFGEHAVIHQDTLYNVLGSSIISTVLTNEIASLKIKNPKSIYYNTATLFSGLYNAALITIILIVAIVIFLRYKRNQSPKISELGIRYKGVSYHLTGKEKRILEEIIASDTVSSQRMYDLVESSTLSYPQNNKIKNDTIKKVNKKIHKILNVKDFIESKKDEKDQRLIIYYTQKAHVFIR
jgi:hypothetical protein